MMFTVEQLKALQKYEGNLRTAVNEDYSRNIPGDGMKEMISIYEEVTGTKVMERMSCGACQLNFLKRLGKMYFEAMQLVAARTEPYASQEYGVAFLGDRATYKAKPSIRYFNPETHRILSKADAEKRMAEGLPVVEIDRAKNVIKFQED